MKLFFLTWVLAGIVAGVVTFAADVQNALFAAGLVGLAVALAITLARLVAGGRRPTDRAAGPT